MARKTLGREFFVRDFKALHVVVAKQRSSGLADPPVVLSGQEHGCLLGGAQIGWERAQILCRVNVNCVDAIQTADRKSTQVHTHKCICGLASKCVAEAQIMRGVQSGLCEKRVSMKYCPSIHCFRKSQGCNWTRGLGSRLHLRSLGMGRF